MFRNKDTSISFVFDSLVVFHEIILLSCTKSCLHDRLNKSIHCEILCITAGHIQDPLKQCNVSYVKIGCYADVNIENSSFPLMILKPVLPLLSEGKTWSLRGESWNTFLKSFVCSCAQKAKQLEYNYFGVKRFGKSLEQSKRR